jgi:hypothetical protein
LTLSCCRILAISLAATALWITNPAFAEQQPKENCARISDMAARNQLAKIPAAVREASGGAIPIEDDTFRGLQPVIDTGSVRFNEFLVEKNYNDALTKIWHLLYFDWQSLYLRCTYLKVDGQWIMTDITFETDEKKIELP